MARYRKVDLVCEQGIGWGAQLVADAFDASKTELDYADGYPTKTPGASLPSASGPVRPCDECNGLGCDECYPSKYTATERAGERRANLSDRRRDLIEAVDAWEAQWQHIVREARHLAGTRIERHEGQRCSGQIDATCTNMAAKHRHPDTNAEEVLVCDHCYLDACRGCRRRSTDGRYIDVEGTPTEVCEACYRRQLRAGRAA